MTTAVQSSTQYVRRISDARQWIRGLLKNCIHTATGSLLATIGTNSVETLSPAALEPYVRDVGMSFSQAVAVFAVSLIIAALRYVNAATAPGNTQPPFISGETP
jgi:hypothetical protein